MLELLDPITERKLLTRSPKADPFRFSLHQKQAQIWHDLSRFNVLVCGRRFGKSRMQLYYAIASCLTYEGEWDPASEPIVLCAMPTLKMAKQIFFRPLVRLLGSDPRVTQIDRTDCTIRFHGQKPAIKVVGANDGHGDRIRGLKLYRALLDEYQDFYSDIWEEVVQPAMIDTRGSKAILTGTPKGKQGSLWNAANRVDPEWRYFHSITAENTAIYGLKRELAKARGQMDARIYRQEFEASFEDFPGKVLSELSDRHLIRNLPENYYRAFLGIDWGDLNPALVVILLTYGGIYVVVDSWINKTGLPVVEDKLLGEIARLCQRYNIYRCFCDPSRPASILEVRNRGKVLGIEGMQRAIKAFNRVVEGNQVVNNLLSCGRLWIHESQKNDVFEKMQSYRRVISKEGIVTDEIEEGQDDHTCDATRYVVSSIEVKHDLSIFKNIGDRAA